MPGAGRSLSVFSVAVVLMLGHARMVIGQEADRPNLAGTWSGPTQTLDDNVWGFEDFACFLGCPLKTFAYAQELFADPDNYGRAYPELHGAVMRRRAADILATLTPAALASKQAFDPADDPAIRCEPYGLVRQVLSPAPIEISLTDDSVTIRYELWSAVRTIPLDEGSGRPSQAARLGYSIGHYEQGVLVVESSEVPANVVAPEAGVLHSAELRTIERYSLAASGNRLNLELTLIDPKTFLEPLTLRTAWTRTPRVQLLPYECNLIKERP